MNGEFPNADSTLRTVSPTVRALMLLLARRYADRTHRVPAGAASGGDAEQAQGAAGVSWLREQLIHRLREEADHSEA